MGLGVGLGGGGVVLRWGIEERGGRGEERKEGGEREEGEGEMRKGS